MQAHTRKHPIDDIEESMTEGDNPMSVGEMISKLCENLPEWAVLLRGLRYREGLTQAEMGRLLKIAQGNISQMEHGKRPIGKRLAKKIASLFKTDYHLFL